MTSGYSVGIKRATFLSAAVAGVMAAGMTHAAVLTWTGTGGTTWDYGTTNWKNPAGTAVAFQNLDDVTFTGAATTLSIAPGGVTPSSMRFISRDQSYVIGGSAILGSGTLLKDSTRDLTLTAANSYSGDTTIKAGKIILGSATSSTIAGTVQNSAVTASNGGSISFDATNLTGSSDISTTRAAALTLNGAGLTVLGSAAVNTNENVTGALAFGQGYSSITLTPAVGKSAVLNFASLSRSAGSTVFVRGTSLGSSGAGVANVTFTSAPTLLLKGGNGAAGSTTMSILPWMYGDQLAGGTGSAFVTYGANGLRPLTDTEHFVLTNAFMSGGGNQDTNADAVSLSPSGDFAVNSLRFKAGANLDITGTMTVQSGGILMRAGSLRIGGAPNIGVLKFGDGTAEALFNFGGTPNPTINSKISTTGGLTRSGTGGSNSLYLTADNSQTLFGTITATGGAISIGNDNSLGAAANTVVLANSGILQATADIITSRSITIAEGGGTIAAGTYNFTTPLPADVTVSGTGRITNPGNTSAVAGSLGKNGPGTLTLASAGNAVGPLNIVDGVMKVTGSLDMKGGSVTPAGSALAARFEVDGGTVTDTQDPLLSNWMNVQGGTATTTPGAMVVTNNGTYTVNGPVTAGVSAGNNIGLAVGSRWSTVTGANPPAATLQVTAGGTVIINGSASLYEGSQSNAGGSTRGDITVDGGSITINGNDANHGLIIGSIAPASTAVTVKGNFSITGTGQLTLQKGTGIGQVAPMFRIGDGGHAANGNALGTFTQSGSSSVSTEGGATFGNIGTSTVYLNGGNFASLGTVNMATGGVTARSVLNVDGGNLNMATSTLQLAADNGATGVALVNLKSGTISANSIKAKAFATGTSTYYSGFSFSGGTLNTKGTDFKLGNVTAPDGTGSTVANTTTAASFVVGDGSGTAAVLNLQGGTHTFASATAGQANLVINSDGTIAGNTAVAVGGSVAVLQGGTIAPGLSTGAAGNGIATLTLASLDLTAATSATPVVLSFDFAAPGTGTNNSDHVVVGSLALSALSNSIGVNMNDLGGLASGTYKIFSYSGAFSGSLSSLYVQNPTVFGGATFSFQDVPGSEIDMVVTIPEPLSIGALGFALVGLGLRRRRQA